MDIITLQTIASLSQEQALKALNTTLQGLKGTEVTKRLFTYGLNQLTKARKRSAVLESLLHSVNPLIGILLIAALISALTGSVVNAVIIAFMVVLSILVDYFQTHRSLIAVERLQATVATTASALRDGEWNEVMTSNLVPGDIIRLSAGDLVPADAVLLTAKDLHVQQAALTGECLPVEKEVCPKGTPIDNITDANHLVFSGSSVISGTALALVVATGQNTLFGEIAKTLTQHPPRTEFENGIVRFGLFISKTIIFLLLFVFVVSIYFKRDALESLLFAIALAVGLTPEFLPMITTVTLATGAIRLSRQKVIVKNLSSMQNLGSIDILCSDKTGTLTTGEMVLEQHFDLAEKSSQKVLLMAYLNSSMQSGIKNPIDEAVLRKTNLNPLDLAILQHDHPDIQPYQKVDEMPFDFERRRSSVVVDKSGVPLLITKGAPEYILPLCTHFELEGQCNLMTDSFSDHCHSLFKSMSKQGYRLLAVAYREPSLQPSYSIKDETNMTLIGFLAFNDPPLCDASEVIQTLGQEKVKVIILTGDNEWVAAHICEQVGIDPKKIMVGDTLAEMTDQALAKVAEDTLVFARVSPNQKQRIIAALKRRGHVVGYIGDGINDAPSLHIADVGISVAGAVDIAKESADIILLEHHLKVLLVGILEGRKAFGNVMKYLMMGTSSNFGNMFSMAGAILFLPFLPMLPAQILLNNLLYDLAQVTIPTDKVDVEFTRKPRHWDIDIIRRFMFYIGPISSIFDFLTFYVMLKIFSASEPLFQTGWFVESLATQTLVIFIIRTASNPFKSYPSLPLLISVCAVVIIGLTLPFTPIAPLLGFVPLPLPYFIFLGCATLAYLLLVQFIKQKLMWKWIK